MLIELESEPKRKAKKKTKKAPVKAKPARMDEEKVVRRKTEKSVKSKEGLSSDKKGNQMVENL